MPNTLSCCSYGFRPGVTAVEVRVQLEQVVGNVRLLMFSINVKPAGVLPPAQRAASMCRSVKIPRSNGPRCSTPERCAQIRRIKSVFAVVPVLATERADGDVQLHDVKELAVAAEDLHPAVFEDIPSCADSGSDLVAPSEVDRIGLSEQLANWQAGILCRNEVRHS